MITNSTFDYTPETPAPFDPPTHYDAGTTDEVKNVIERAILATRLNQWKPTRVRIYYGDPETGRDYLEEWLNMGYIGRSMGTQPIPILIASTRSRGGPGICTRIIVKMTINKVTVYQHPNYHQPDFTIRPSDDPRYTVEVYAGNQIQARFETTEKATRYIDYMTGKRDSH